MVNKKLLSDNPIVKLENDFLYNEFIDLVYQEILSIEKDNTPFVIGLNGKWGSGKTSVMKLLKEKIDSTNKEELKEKIYITVWFESWKYNSYELIGNSLIYNLFDSITLSDKAFFKIRGEFFRELVEITNEIPLLKNISSATKKAIEINKGNVDLTIWEKSFKKAMDVISEKIDKIIIFVDDLDRCSKDSLLSFFEYIKLHLNIKGVIFVIGVDKENIIKELSGVDDNDKHDKEYYENYLEKIVQHWYEIPYLKLSEKILFLYEFLQEDEEIKILNKFLKIEEFKNFISESTLRRLKQFINKFFSKLNHIGLKIEKKKIFLLSFLEFYYKLNFYDLKKIIRYDEKYEEIINDLKEVYSEQDLENKINKYGGKFDTNILENYFDFLDFDELYNLKQGKEEDFLKEVFGKEVFLGKEFKEELRIYENYKKLFENSEITKNDLYIYFGRLIEFDEIIELIRSFINEEASLNKEEEAKNKFEKLQNKIKELLDKMDDNKIKNLQHLFIYYYGISDEYKNYLKRVNSMNDEIKKKLPIFIEYLENISGNNNLQSN